MEDNKPYFEVLYLDDNDNKHLAYATEIELKTLENRYEIIGKEMFYENRNSWGL